MLTNKCLDCEPLFPTYLLETPPECVGEPCAELYNADCIVYEPAIEELILPVKSRLSMIIATIVEKLASAGGLQVQSDFAQNDDTQVDFIKNKPTIPSQYTDDMADARIAAGITEKVNVVAGKGLSSEDFQTIYKEKLLGIEALAQVNVKPDWNALVGAADEILNKPAAPEGQTQTDWDAVDGLGVILNKPTIPAAQVQSDWNAVTGISVIGNKPIIPSISGLISSSSITVIQALTQIEYDAITTPLSTTLYFIR